MSVSTVISRRREARLWPRKVCASVAVAIAAVFAFTLAAPTGAHEDEPAVALKVAEKSAATAGPATGLADSAGLRATVFGPSAAELAPMPATVPLAEIDLKLPWANPVPAVFWFDRRLRVWFSAQDRPAPLAIVIAGTGGGGNATKLAVLRGALYGAGYHVLTMPSPTFPGFIVSASTTGVAGDLLQDSRDLYAAMAAVLARLPGRVQITDVDVLGYSLGGANAAVVKSIDAREGKLHIHRAIMINPPVSLFTSVARLDKLFASSIGSGDAGVDRLYRQLYAEVANLYLASGKVELDEDFLLAAAAAVLKTDAEFSAAIALDFRLDLVNMFFAGDMYARTGVVVDPSHPPKVGDSLEATARRLRDMPFTAYFARVFVPYYTKHRAHATSASLIADNRLDIIADLSWLEKTLGTRIVVYDHGGHLGNLGERAQIADMLEMLAGRWRLPAS
jgi:predicted alpha/beta-fold hydrolase